VPNHAADECASAVLLSQVMLQQPSCHDSPFSCCHGLVAQQYTRGRQAVELLFCFAHDHPCADAQRDTL